MKEWIAAKDARTRRIPPDQFDHYHMDGKKVEMDEYFEVKSKKGFNEAMLHPCDPSGSAGDVCNCRCTIGFEAQRDSKGKLKTYQSHPPKGDVGYMHNLLSDRYLMDITQLIAQSLG
jgi:hypothetical protein